MQTCKVAALALESTLAATAAFAQSTPNRSSLGSSIAASVNRAVAEGNTNDNSVAVGVTRNQSNAGNGGRNVAINRTPGIVVNGQARTLGSNTSGSVGPSQSNGFSTK